MFPSVDSGIACSRTSDGALELVFQDGSRWRLPFDIISRSPILIDALACAEPGTHGSLLAPHGYVESWLGCVSSQCTFRRSTSNGSLARYLQAADYFADDLAIHEILSLLGSRLFQQRLPAGRGLDDAMRRDIDFEILKGLPLHLMISIIQASPSSLKDKLKSLPQELHALTIQATFPAIASEHSVYLDGKKHCPWTVSAALRAAATFNDARRVCVSDACFDSSPDTVEALVFLLSKLDKLTDLRISEWMQNATALRDICRAAEAHTSLERLELKPGEFNSQHSEPIVALLKSTPHIKHLVLNQDTSKISWTKCSELFSVISSLTAITHLEIVNNPISPEDVPSLCLALQPLKSIEHLDLEGSYIMSEGAAQLANVLAHLSALTALNLASNMISCYGMQSISDSILSLRKLSVLNLSRNRISANGAAYIAPLLAASSPLRQLLLASNSLGLSGMQALAPALHHATRLYSLDISNNRLPDPAMVLLARSLAHLPHLRHLNTSGHIHTCDTLKASTIPTLATLHRLQSLHLDVSPSCPLKQCAEPLAAALQGMHAMRDLRLSVGSLTNSPTSTLAPIIGSFSMLDTLHLSFWLTTDLASKALATGLSHLHNLSHLSLHCSNFQHGIDTSAVLAPAIAEMTALTALCMDNMHISATGAEALSTALHTLTNLERASINGNPIGNSGAKFLSQALQNSHNLQRLELCDCGIGEDGAEDVANLLGALPHMRWLEVANNSISQAGVEALVHALDAHAPCVQRADFRGNMVQDMDADEIVRDWVVL